MHNWSSLKAFFDVLNEKSNYVVLRNYENFADSLLTDEHPDIDILCDNRDVLLSVSKSEPRHENDKIHRKILVDNKEVDLDVRYVGDGYYDTKWERELLSNRRLYNGLCYVLTEEYYYYSLLYHALIQKFKISDDYISRLKNMAEKCGISGDEALSIDTLQNYMRKHGYSFTYPAFVGGITNFRRVDKAMIKKNPLRICARFLYKVKIHLRKRK
ncbi:MAG: hypothetical protein IK057_02405 [Clostridia bacterium]|nr:hypothetical protein [Clostridia bacterium]